MSNLVSPKRMRLGSPPSTSQITDMLNTLHEVHRVVADEFSQKMGSLEEGIRTLVARLTNERETHQQTIQALTAQLSEEQAKVKRMKQDFKISDDKMRETEALKDKVRALELGNQALKDKLKDKLKDDLATTELLLADE